MFFLKKRNKKQYDIIKLYKIVNLKEAKIFDIKKCINECDIFFQEKINCKPESFDLNFGFKEWNSYNNFKKSIEKIKSNNIFSFLAIHENNNSLISITNNLLNSNQPEELSYVEIILVLNTSFLNDSISFIKKINDEFEIDYGYGVTLDESYDFITEKKKKRTLFGFANVASITQDDIDWYEKAPNIKKGYVRKMYKFNILNNSQLSSSLVKGFIRENSVNSLDLSKGLKIIVSPPIV